MIFIREFTKYVILGGNMMTGHFWYSGGQARAIQRSHRTECVAEIAGKRHTYTEWTSGLAYNSAWKDVLYLGYGSLYSVNGVVQHGTESKLRSLFVRVASHIVTPICRLVWAVKHDR